MAQHTATSVKIHGVIIPNDFNRNGEPIEIVIETDTFIQYRIAQNLKGRELMDHTFKQIAIQGMLDVETEPPIIVIDHYQVLS